MNLNTMQQSILAGCLADVERVRRIEPHRNSYGQYTDLRQAEDIKLANEGIVRSDPARWLGQDLSAGDYVMLSRSYKALEKAGLIRRHKLGFGGVGKTHIEITDAGRAAI